MYCSEFRYIKLNNCLCIFFHGLTTVWEVPVFESRSPRSRWSSFHVLHRRATSPENVSAAGDDKEEHLASDSLLSILWPPQRVQEVLQDRTSNQLHQRHARLYPFYIVKRRNIFILSGIWMAANGFQFCHHSFFAILAFVFNIGMHYIYLYTLHPHGKWLFTCCLIK